MKLSDLIGHATKALEKDGDVDVRLATMTSDGESYVFYEDPVAILADVPEDDEGKVHTRVFLVGWHEVLFPEERPKKTKLEVVK